MPFRARLRADRDRGFTLIELLVVITLLGVLAAIAVLATNKFRKSSTTSACATDVRSDILAIDQYKTKHSTYPPNVAALTGEKLINSLEDSNSYTIEYESLTPFTTYKLKVKVPETEAVATDITQDSSKSAINAACTG